MAGTLEEMWRASEWPGLDRDYAMRCQMFSGCSEVWHVAASMQREHSGLVAPSRVHCVDLLSGVSEYRRIA